MIKQTKYIIFYSSSIAGTINERDIGDAFESIYTTIISNIQKALKKVQVKLLIQP